MAAIPWVSDPGKKFFDKVIKKSKTRKTTATEAVGQ
jgi:hypothetical protein